MSKVLSNGKGRAWHQIWSNRQKLVPDGEVLQQLISLDGFDTPLGLMSESEWRSYVSLLAKRSGIIAGDSIFEIGCGAGAFLYPLYEQGFNVAGIDYSEVLLGVAKTAMPRHAESFSVLEAINCPASPPNDVIVANHVIHYFPSIEYFGAVLDLMLCKANRVVSISGIPNLELMKDSENSRRALLGDEEYEKKYRGLEILYFGKDWFMDYSDRYGFQAEFFDHQMPGFAQAEFRFDCVLTKIG